jgi:murein L,D-transpeptidase YcbB/YkuD
MHKKLRRTIGATLLACCLFAAPYPAAALSPQSLQDAADHLPASAPDAAVIQDFYKSRDFRPVWFDGDRLSRAGDALLSALARSDEHAIPPARYGMPGLAAQVRAASGDAQAASEIALTHAYLRYARDVSSGVVDNAWQVRVFRAMSRPAPRLLLDRVASAADAAAVLAGLPPDSRRYDQLKAALAAYRRIEAKGGWPSVAPGPILRPGAHGARVAEVKRRLLVTGDLAAIGDAETYDDALTAAVKRFQQRHGLVDDGHVGLETVAEMNVPVQARVAQIAINLERRRWLAPHLGPRYIYLNIADNDLKIVENGHTIHVAKVIVGKPYQQTPVFSAQVKFIEINPYWNVPSSIAVKEMLPIIRRNPGYLAANHYLLLTRPGDNNSAIDPRVVDWSAVDRRGFPYFIRQMPGPNNALGRIVFRFPNPYNVFVHDTPARQLFSLESRYFSHGCMRVQDPLDIALLLLGHQDGGIWTRQRLEKIVASRNYTVVHLARPIDIHITYLTAWAERDGLVEFRRDVYRRDPAVRAALTAAGAPPR